MQEMRDVQRSPFDRLRLGEPCHITVRRCWPLMVAGLTLESEAARVPELPREELAAIPGWPALRGLLLHAVVLRDALATETSTDLDAIHTVAGLIDWIDQRAVDWWHQLLAAGAVRGWAFYCQAADSEAERVRRQRIWPVGAEGPGWWRDSSLFDQRVRIQALLWEITEAELEPVLSDRQHALAVLANVLQPAARLIDAVMPRLGRNERRVAPDLAQAFWTMTGRPLQDVTPGELADVRHLVVVPTPGLTRQDAVSVARRPDRWTVWVAADATDLGAQTVDISRILVALGDDLNTQIVENLSAQGPAHALLLAERLPAHPSTLSRHLNAMADAGVLRVRPQGHKVVYHLNPAALDRLATWARQLNAEEA